MMAGGCHATLEDLEVAHNALVVLPREVALLTRLARLDLAGNALVVPPARVAATGVRRPGGGAQILWVVLTMRERRAELGSMCAQGACWACACGCRPTCPD